MKRSTFRSINKLKLRDIIDDEWIVRFSNIDNSLLESVFNFFINHKMTTSTQELQGSLDSKIEDEDGENKIFLKCSLNINGYEHIVNIFSNRDTRQTSFELDLWLSAYGSDSELNLKELNSSLSALIYEFYNLFYCDKVIIYSDLYSNISDNEIANISSSELIPKTRAYYLYLELENELVFFDMSE